MTQQEFIEDFESKNSVLEIVRDGEEIADSIYLDSFIIEEIEYHICLKFKHLFFLLNLSQNNIIFRIINSDKFYRNKLHSRSSRCFRYL